MAIPILSFPVAQTQSQPDPVDIIQFFDTRLQMYLQANVYDGYVTRGKAYLVIQPTHQFICGSWLPVDCDDTAFPCDTVDMTEIESVL